MRRTTRQQLVSLAVSVLAAGVVIALCLAHRDQLERCAQRIPPAVFAGARRPARARADRTRRGLAGHAGWRSMGGVPHAARCTSRARAASSPARCRATPRCRCGCCWCGGSRPNHSPPLRDFVARRPDLRDRGDDRGRARSRWPPAPRRALWAALFAPLAALPSARALRHATDSRTARGIVRGLAILARDAPAAPARAGARRRAAARSRACGCCSRGAACRTGSTRSRCCSSARRC